MSGLIQFDVKEHKGTHTSLVSVVLRSWTELEEGTIAITPQMTALEVDTNIQMLKDELDLIARKAKLIAQ